MEPQATLDSSTLKRRERCAPKTALDASPVSVSTASQIRHLFISPGHNYFGHHEQPPGQHPVLERAEIECVAGRGIRGDRFFDYKENYKGQITFFAWEVFEQLRRALGLPDAHPSGTRRNVITEGIGLNALVGEEFELQGIRFLGVEECRPCYWMNNAFRHEQAESWLKGNGGLRARILTEGVLKVSVASAIPADAEPGFQPGGKNAASGTTPVTSERHDTAAVLSGRQDTTLHGKAGGAPLPLDSTLLRT